MTTVTHYSEMQKLPDPQVIQRFVDGRRRAGSNIVIGVTVAMIGFALFMAGQTYERYLTPREIIWAFIVALFFFVLGIMMTIVNSILFTAPLPIARQIKEETTEAGVLETERRGDEIEPELIQLSPTHYRMTQQPPVTIGTFTLRPKFFGIVRRMADESLFTRTDLEKAGMPTTDYRDFRAAMVGAGYAGASGNSTWWEEPGIEWAASLLPPTP